MIFSQKICFEINRTIHHYSRTVGLFANVVLFLQIDLTQMSIRWPLKSWQITSFDFLVSTKNWGYWNHQNKQLVKQINRENPIRTQFEFFVCKLVLFNSRRASSIYIKDDILKIFSNQKACADLNTKYQKLAYLLYFKYRIPIFYSIFLFVTKFQGLGCLYVKRTVFEDHKNSFFL